MYFVVVTATRSEQVPGCPVGRSTGNRFSRGERGKQKKIFNDNAEFMLLVGRYVDIEYTPLLFGNSTPMATFHLLLVGSTDTYWEKKWRALLPAPEPPGGRHRCCLPHTSLVSPPRLQSPPSTRCSAIFSCQQHVSDAASESSTLVSLHHKKSQFWQASSLTIDWPGSPQALSGVPKLSWDQPSRNVLLSWFNPSVKLWQNRCLSPCSEASAPH